jgi:hypothetical protein
MTGRIDDLDVNTATRTGGRQDKKYERLTRPPVASRQCSVRPRRTERRQSQVKKDPRSRQSTERAADRDVDPTSSKRRQPNPRGPEDQIRHEREHQEPSNGPRQKASNVNRKFQEEIKGLWEWTITHGQPSVSI